MAQVMIPRWSLYAGVIALVAAIAFSLGGFYTARSVNHDQTYYGCLFAGSLSQVNTTAPPANCGRGQQVSWNAQGIQGLQGIQGIQGLPGEPGVSGWEVLVSEPVTVSPNAVSQTAFGDCPTGKVALGGGVITFPVVASEAARVIGTGPMVDGNGWFGRVINDGDTAFSAIVRYMCAFVEVEEQP